MSGVTLWTVSYAMEVGNTTVLQKLIWSNLQYLGVLIIPPALLVFILNHTHQERYLTKLTWGIFFSFTLVSLVLVFTDTSHHLLRQNLTFVSTPFPELIFDYGPVYLAILIYFYIVLFLSALALIHQIMQSSAFYRGQSYALLIAMLFPWAGSVLEISGVGLIDHLSPVVFSFIISGGTEIATASGLVHITVSIGIAECGPDCSTLDHLLGMADAALYIARMGGRDRVCQSRD